MLLERLERYAVELEREEEANRPSAVWRFASGYVRFAVILIAITDYLLWTHTPLGLLCSTDFPPTGECYLNARIWLLACIDVFLFLWLVAAPFRFLRWLLGLK